MSGLYLHIPFCKTKCLYCNFYAVASQRLALGFTETLLLEIENRSHQWIDLNLQTIYLGGGTPSLLPSEEIEKIMNAINRYFIVKPPCEITLEANPDDITIENLQSWLNAGVNRLSIGIQALDDHILKFLGRRHNTAQALQAYSMARNAGFKNISLDLIFGIPGLKNENWENTLKKILSLYPEHLSCYALTLEEKTVYDDYIRKGKYPSPNDDLAAQQYEILQDITSKNGYLQYEISNFCLPGYHSRHNSAYWHRIPYLGLGPSAHSFDGAQRWWNPPSLKEWKRMVSLNEACPSEILTTIDKYNEYIMTSLRTSWGIKLSFITEKFGTSFAEYTLKIANSLMNHFLQQADYDTIVIHPKAYILADGIIEKFFLTQDDKNIDFIKKSH